MLLEEFDPSLSINPTLPSINPSISQAVFSGGPVTVNVRSTPVAADVQFCCETAQHGFMHRRPTTCSCSASPKFDHIC